ncbi:unnamed protein product, partial [Chrysoparadoxa australica]
GTCLADATGEPFCRCNEGYDTRNDYNEPSCVPEGLWPPICKLILIVNSIVVVQSIFRFIKLYHDVPRKNNGAPGSIVGWHGLKLTKTNELMFRLYVTSGVCCLTHASLSLIYPLGKLFALWTIGAFPAGMIACLTTCQLWLQSLPLQLLPPGTLAFTFKKLIGDDSFIRNLNLSMVVFSIVPAMIVIATPTPPRIATAALNYAACACCVLCLTATMVMGVTLYKQLSSLDLKGEEERKKNMAIKRKIMISLVIANQILIGAFTFFLVTDIVALGRATRVAVRGFAGIFPALWYSFNQEVMKYSKSKAALQKSKTTNTLQGSPTAKSLVSQNTLQRSPTAKSFASPRKKGEQTPLDPR